MAKEDLIPFTSEQSRTKAKENGRKGGIASGKAKREKKAMKEQMITLLSLPLKDESVKQKFKQLGIKTDDMDNQMALVVATYQKALRGDTSAINIVREMIGERVQEISVTQNIDQSVKEFDNYVNNRNTKEIS